MKREKVLKNRTVMVSDEKAELLRRTRELSALLAVAEVAAQSLDTQKILSDTLDKSLQVLGFKLGYIRILDAEAGGLVVRVARGLSSSEFIANTIPLDSPRRSVSKIVFETREPYICSDIRKDRSFRHGFMAQEGLKSAAFVPIMSKYRVLGLMMVGSSKFHKFSGGQINLLHAFGSHLGSALENAQLYDEVSKGKNYIENLVDNAGDVIISTDMEDRILTLEPWGRSYYRLQKKRAHRKASLHFASSRASLTNSRKCARKWRFPALSGTLRFEVRGKME